MSDGIVCFAGQDWYIHGRAHCDFQVMRELAGDDRVLVVNSIGMRVPIPGRTEAPARRIVRKLRSILRHYVARPLPAVPNLVLMSPVAVPAFTTRAARRLNGAVVAAQVRAAAAAHRVRDPWVVVAVPTAIDAIELAGWSDRVIYYRADDNAAQPDVDHQLIRAFEDRVIAAAHLVLYSSATLLERERERVGDKGVFFDHGVEVDHFHAADRTEPTDVAAIARPRIGFVGAIDQQSVDLDLIDRLATEFPDASIVMIGRSATDDARLTAHANVHLLGARAYEEVPDYMASFDVAINPKPATAWASAANPIKLKEYLAMGLPVVSSGSDDVARFADVVALAAHHDEFVEGVRAALAGAAPGSAATRRESVLVDGWNRRAERLRELIAELPTGSAPRTTDHNGAAGTPNRPGRN